MENRNVQLILKMRQTHMLYRNRIFFLVDVPDVDRHQSLVQKPDANCVGNVTRSWKLNPIYARTRVDASLTRSQNYRTGGNEQLIMLKMG